jgi:hypothetical protein
VTGEAQKNLRSAAKDTEAGHSACHFTHFTCGTRCAPADTAVLEGRRTENGFKPRAKNAA